MLKITKLNQGSGKNLEKGGNSKQRKLFFNWKKRLIAIIIFISFMGLLPILTSLDTEASISRNKEINIIGYQEIRDLDETLKIEVASYIKNNSFGSQVDSKKLIKACYDENFDIILALSQAQVESHFGTRGVASRTNSIFNVGTYDNGVILYSYKDPNLSIHPYISLMKRKYLVNEKSTNDLLKPRGFINYKGKRYASLRAYEYRVKKVYDHIVENTSIKQLWDVYIKKDVIISREIWNSGDSLHSLINS